MAAKGKIPPAPQWDLDSIFPGGSKSVEFKKHREKVKNDLVVTKAMLDKLPTTLEDGNIQQWADFVLKWQAACEDTGLVLSFSGCLASADVSDNEADAIYSEGFVYYSQCEKIGTQFEALAMKQSDEIWGKLVAHPDLVPVRFCLDEIREIARSKMSVELESLALDLSVNGFHAWNQIYDKMAGELRVDFQQDGKTENISMGQLATKFSDPDRKVRHQAFEKMTEGWNSRADLSAMMLNAIGGFRLSLYENRKWDSVMHAPLVASRMQQKTLDTMWKVVARETQRLKPYIEAKKKLLGIDKYKWYDEFAPVGSADKLYAFDDAGDFIVEQSRAFSPHLADFCRMALDKRWIEAEDRAGKRGGGFCSGMGAFRQSRIFMTYAGSYENLLTLAHELGHAYHSHVLKDRPYFATEYPMNLAETASIFSESLVTDAALGACKDPGEKLMLLEQKIQGVYVMFCDLHSRYIFEQQFFAERKKGVVGKDRLSEIMIAAQKEAFGDLLDESGYHPLFWCSKLHFYLTDQPFYNFPYTFGFLFSGGIYDRAKKEGSAFAKKYQALLADTGSMSTEELARKHLDVDLTEEKFWVDAVNLALADVDEFVKLAEQA
ncbi:MAG: M3 family oligoendopeptidase [candidate division Zixibacteria bacterium]|nr:M3 family oligoendopeptidase [candidate division Zixibacteria bacterium]